MYQLKEHVENPPSHSSASLSSSNKDPRTLRGEALAPWVSETDSGFSMSPIACQFVDRLDVVHGADALVVFREICLFLTNQDAGSRNPRDLEPERALSLHENMVMQKGREEEMYPTVE